MKVAIIGAGINGLYLSWKLSKMGHEVTVFEKKNTIGKEACSGLFSERILDFIPQLRRKVGAPTGTSESQKLIQNQINFTLIHFPKKTVRVDFAKKFFVMSHAELDKVAADLARKAGAKIILRSDLDGVRSDLADFVIGCDGANSETRKSLGLPDPEYRLGILGFVSRKDNSNFVETWPVGNGFIWKIPRGKETEYGIIADLNNARKLLDDFCQKNNLSLENIKSALIPQEFLIPKNDKITLCGDAAGLTKPWSGGGVIWGLTAADLLLKNFPDFVKYNKDAKKVFHYKIIFSKLLTKAVYFLGNSKISWLLPDKIKIDGDKLL